MNDLHYIAYDAKRMFLDTVGMSCEGERAHRRLCDYVWFNDGPPFDNNEVLRQITYTKESDWARVKRELLAKGWVNAGDYLLHRGVIESLNESKEKYIENYNRTCKANNKTPLKLSFPDPVTGCVTLIAADNVTPNVTPPVTLYQSESESESEPVRELVRERQISQSAARVREDLTKLTLQKQGCGRIAKLLLTNETGCFYDNCKVKPEEINAKSLQTALEEFAGKTTEPTVLKCWNEAVTRTHKAAVDGLAKDIPAYCISVFKDLLKAP